ncbi:MAG TPA: dihydrolipoamide acetyltransferase family protein [Jiangellaceae bacterium]
MAEVFKLPDVGEGLTEAEIVSWKVRPGDTVKVNDVIVEIETAKSLVELPCPFAGEVEGLLVDEGATVPVGTPIISVRTADSGSAGAAPEAPSAAEPSGESGESNGDGDRQAVLVGYGPRSTAAKRRPRKTSTQPESGQAAPVRDASVDHDEAAHPGGNGPTRRDQPNGEGAPTAAQPTLTGAGVLAKPPVRKLAKDLGVDLRTVPPSGEGGIITRDDVRAAAEAPAARPGVHAGDGWDGLPREERIAIKSVRKVTAENVTRSAFTAPHVTEFVTVDVTRMVRLLDRLRESREFREVKLSPLTVLARAMCLAAKRTPDVNSRWDDEAGEIVVQRYVNLGIAAATPRGLVVPNIKDADRMSLRELAVAINELAATAREGKTQPADMAGGTMSITNVGVFGVDTGTPILPPGEAAIMCLGAVKQQPWVHKGKIKPRWVTTLGLSFDHRLVDGEQGSKFLADVAALLEDPANAIVW